MLIALHAKSHPNSILLGLQLKPLLQALAIDGRQGAAVRKYETTLTPLD